MVEVVLQRVDTDNADRVLRVARGCHKQSCFALELQPSPRRAVLSLGSTLNPRPQGDGVIGNAGQAHANVDHQTEAPHQDGVVTEKGERLVEIDVRGLDALDGTQPRRGGGTRNVCATSPCPRRSGSLTLTIAPSSGDRSCTNERAFSIIAARWSSKLSSGRRSKVDPSYVSTDRFDRSMAVST